MSDPSPNRADRLTRALERRELAAYRQRVAVSRSLGVREDDVLALLHLAEYGSSTHGELGTFLGLSRSGAGAMIQRLERAGLIERETDPSDKRVRQITLTSATSARLADAYADLREGVTRLLGELSEAERTTVEWFVSGLAELSDLQARRATADDDHPETDATPSAWTLWH